MKFGKYAILGFLAGACSCAFATEITVSAGSFLNNRYGEVLTQGKAYAFKGNLTEFTNDIIRSGVPRTNDELIAILERGTFSGVNARYGNIQSLNERIAGFQPMYTAIKNAWIKDTNENAESRIKQSRDYQNDMRAYEEVNALKVNFNQELGPLVEELETLQNKASEIDAKLVAMDDEFIQRANAILAANSANPRLISKSSGSIKLLKFREAGRDRKSGECRVSKRWFSIDKRSEVDKCFDWTTAQAWQEHLDEFGAIAESYVLHYYELKKSLGRSARDKGSLKHQVKQKESELKSAFGAFKKRHGVGRASLSGLQQRFRHNDAIPVRWENVIERAKNARFDPNQSGDFQYQIMDPYLVSLRQYYNSVAEEILDKSLVESISINDYKFDIDAGSFYTIFIDLQSPGQKANFGILVKSSGMNKLMAEQYRNNTMVVGFDPGTSDRDYVLAAMILLMD